MRGFSDEILLRIVECVSQSQLATLCRVSRKLDAMCKPLLYRDVSLQDSHYTHCLSSLESLAAHPGMVSSLYFGRDTAMNHPLPAGIAFERILKALDGCLKAQKGMISVYFNHGQALEYLLSGSEGQNVLDSLVRFEKLREVSIANSKGIPESFSNRIPSFGNLYKLELLSMSQEQCDRARQVSRVLISCPYLRQLSLSTVYSCGEDDIALLPTLVRYLEDANGKKLRLCSLRLGYGFLPIETGTDYVSRLTELSALQALRLDNDNIGVHDIGRDAPIDAAQFESANNVKTLTAERLSADIFALINVLNSSGQLINLSLPRFCNTQPRARMDENNEFWDPERWDLEVEDLPEWDPEQLFSQPLDQAGNHWRTLLIGDIFHTCKIPKDVLDCITTYEHLEDLTLPLPKELWPKFRDDVLPRLRNLQRLFLVGRENASGYGFQGLVPDHTDWKTNTPQEFQDLVEKHDAELENHWKVFARDVFRANRVSIAQDDERVTLKYLGLSGDVYTCMRLPPGASCGLASFSIGQDGKRWEYDVVKLTSDEAAAFKMNREWHESISELRVGGDDGDIVY